MKIVLERKYKKEEYTIGVLYVNGKRLCNTLEPTDRGLVNNSLPGKTESKDWRCAKIDALLEKAKNKKGTTAIPTGLYNITEAISSKFNARRLFLRDVPGFTGIMIHEGNTRRNTQGCILVGDNTIKGRVQKSQYRLKQLNDLVFAALEVKEAVILKII